MVQQSTETVETVPTDEITMAPPATEDVSALDRHADFAELIACIEAGVARSKRRVTTFKRIFTFVSVPSACAIIALVLAPLFLANPRHPFAPKGPWILIFEVSCYAMICVFGGLVWLRRDHRLESERTAVRRLVKMDDVRAAAPMIDTIQWVTQWIGDKTLRSEFRQELGRLLSRMNEEEARELGKERLGILAVWIQGWDLPLVQKPFEAPGNQPLLGMLHVMGHVGQSSILVGQAPGKRSVSLLPTLETWIRGQDSGRDPEVQAAAIACWDAIQRKMALARSGEQLLRASAPTTAGQESLLRPAQGSRQSDPHELLRPSDPE